MSLFRHTMSVNAPVSNLFLVLSCSVLTAPKFGRSLAVFQRLLHGCGEMVPGKEGFEGLTDAHGDFPIEPTRHIILLSSKAFRSAGR